MMLHEKVQLLILLWEGKSYAAVGCHYGINKSTIHYMKKESAIKSTVAVNFYERAKRVMTVKNKHIVRMESILALWISYCKKNIPLDGNIIHDKAWKSYQ